MNDFSNLNSNSFKNKKGKETPLSKDDIMKYEIAEELGYLEKVQQTGWKSLTARESGKIGGIMSRMKKLEQNKSNEANSDL